MKIIGKILLFCSSYLLLFIILFIRELDNYLSLEQGVSVNPIILKISLYLILVMISILAIIAFKTSYTHGSIEDKTKIKIKSVSDGNQEIVSYLITFIFPLIGNTSTAISTNEWIDFLTMLIIITFLAILYINSSLVVINPILVLMGYSIYKIYFTYDDFPNVEFEGILLTQGPFNRKLISSTLVVNSIDENAFILRRLANGKRKNPNNC
jgi:hypothetical protein